MFLTGFLIKKPRFSTGFFWNFFGCGKFAREARKRIFGMLSFAREARENILDVFSAREARAK